MSRPSEPPDLKRIMFSQTVEYALRALVTLAFRYDDPMTVQQISEVAHIPRPYLSKMMQNLARCDLVRSRRGLGGGFALAQPPDKTTIWDIINAVDPIRRIHTCPREATEGQDPSCPLQHRFDQALTMLEELFHDTTLGNVVDEIGDRSGLCGWTPEEPSGPT